MKWYDIVPDDIDRFVEAYGTLTVGHSAAGRATLAAGLREPREGLTRVLVIFSWDDDVSQNRYERMRQDQRLRPYEFHQRFALPSPHTRPNTDLLYAMISTAVENVQPDVLLIHTGAAYHRSPESFAKCLLRLRGNYPTLRLGLQRHQDAAEFLERLGIFEESKEMLTIESDFLD